MTNNGVNSSLDRARGPTDDPRAIHEPAYFDWWESISGSLDPALMKHWSAFAELEPLHSLQEDEFRWIYHHQREALNAVVNAARTYANFPGNPDEIPAHNHANPFTSWAQQTDRASLERCAALDVGAFSKTSSGFCIVAAAREPHVHERVAGLVASGCYLIDGGETVLAPPRVLEELKAATQVGLDRWHSAALLRLRGKLAELVARAAADAQAARSAADADANPDWYLPTPRRPASHVEMSWRDDLGNCPACGFARCAC